jgi:uncharacterized protein YndB with AHSA1/START domain
VRPPSTPTSPSAAATASRCGCATGGDRWSRANTCLSKKPRRLVFTWTNEALGVRDSVVTVELRPTGEGATEITITHALAPESEAGRRHARGWEGSLDNLARHLASSVAEAR